ncbi:phospholipid scramblase 2-like isoform 1-T2 [Molossus nigricans]
MDGQRPLGNGDLPGSPRAYEADPSVSPPGCPGADPVGFPVRLQPVRHQPGLSEAVPEMPEPAPTSDCPPGLECLNQMDEIRIHQQIDLLEVFLNIKMNNKYEIKNSLGQTIYLVMEDNNFCTRNCCGSKRPFTMRILDLMDQEVITLERPLRCNCFCLSCCLQEIKVCAPPGTPIGYITQTKHLYLPTFTIQNENKKDILKIIGPFLSCKCCGDINFEIQSLDKENVVGKISKLWTSLVRELLTDYSDFIVQFPADLDAKMKAVTLGACFLIDFMLFENSYIPQILNFCLKAKLC